MAIEEIKSVQLSTYLEVLKQLPDIQETDRAAAVQVLQNAFGDSYSKAVEFNRGLKYGDGKIQATQLFRSEGGGDLPTQMVIDSSGLVQNGVTGFSGQLSPQFTRYFIGGLFGTGELAGSIREAFELLQIEGAQKLYQCAVSSGGLAACNNSEGADKIAEAKRSINTRERTERRDANLKAAETIWGWAGQLREASRGSASGDPDDIQSVMDRYAIYKNYADTANDVHNAWVRVQRAREMMKAIGENDGGRPQFEKKFCSKGPLVDQGKCNGGTYQTYQLSCPWNVATTETVREDNCKETKSSSDGDCHSAACAAADSRAERQSGGGGNCTPRKDGKEPVCHGKGCE